MLEIDSIEFHSDVFHAGVNFGKKLGRGTPKDSADLKVEIDEKRTFVKLTYKGRVREFPSLSAFSWEVKGDKIPEVPKNEHKTESVEGRRRAQVSTPTGHVFDGEGAGKTGKSK